MDTVINTETNSGIDTIVIDMVTPECRMAFLGRSRVLDIQIYRPSAGARAGDVILGRVRAVVPSIRGTFINIGDQRDGFLPFPEKAARPPVQEGEAVIVQVRHEAMADKGARLTTRVSLAGRYAVYTPDQPGINVSRKGNDPTLADQAAAAIADEIEPGDGAIIRTATLLLGSAGIARATTELSGFRDAWRDARARQSQVKPPHCLLRAPDPVLQALQGISSAQIRRVVVEGADGFLRAKSYLTAAEPDFLDRLEQYQGLEGVFAAEGVESELDAILGPYVPLPSGGCLHIHDTPACVTVDVDTDNAGSGGGKKGLDLIRQTNEEAADTLAWALRLRNLSGNIVVDFIRDGDKDAGRALLDRLAVACSNDPVPVEVAGFSRLGLVEITRRRRAMSLPEVLSGRRGATGVDRSPETLAYDALRQLHHVAYGAPGRPLTVRAHGDVIAMIGNELKFAMEDTTTRAGVSVTLTSDETAPPGMVDVYAT